MEKIEYPRKVTAMQKYMKSAAINFLLSFLETKHFLKISN